MLLLQRDHTLIVVSDRYILLLVVTDRSHSLLKMINPLINHMDPGCRLGTDPGSRLGT